jgi:hypothetical protein
MKFKEWLKLDEARFKGFLRQYAQQNPDVPKYVLKQMYINHLSPNMRVAIEPYMRMQTPTVNYVPDQNAPFEPNAHTTAWHSQSHIDTPKSVVDSTLKQTGVSVKPHPDAPSQLIRMVNLIDGVHWSPKPTVVSLSPTDFDDETLSIFYQWRFGFRPRNDLVRNDKERFDIQRNLMINRQNGKNEPIILVKIDDKYKLIEGFHRTMNYLLSAAPPEHLQLLQAGRPLSISALSSWGKVPIKAYIGIKAAQT